MTRRLVAVLLLGLLAACAGADRGRQGRDGPPLAPVTPGLSSSSDGIRRSSPDIGLPRDGAGTAPRRAGMTRSASSLGVPADLPVDAPRSGSTGGPRVATVTMPAPEAGQRLGTTIATLGDPSLPGLWVRTPLVQEEGAGRIVDPVTRRSVRVRLLPAPAGLGTGSQVSLAAMQMLGLGVTELPVVELYTD